MSALAVRNYPKERKRPATAWDRRPLSHRLTEVLQLFADGKTVCEISLILGISENVVRWHKRRIYERLEINNHTQLVKYAIAQGITTAESWR